MTPRAFPIGVFPIGVLVGRVSGATQQRPSHSSSKTSVTKPVPAPPGAGTSLLNWRFRFETVALLPPLAMAAVWTPPAMLPGTKAKANSRTTPAASSPAASPTTPVAVRPPPHLGLFVRWNLRLGLHLRQRRPQRLRFALRCRQRHSEAEGHCQA